jgi:hypothetical protein
MQLRLCALFLLPIALFASTLAAQPSAFAALSPARSPEIATAHGITVAVLFTSSTSAQLVVHRGATEEAKSPTFAFPIESNYGAAWVESVKILSASRFSVALRTRQSCGPGVHNYFFSQSKGQWLLTRLDREENECTETGNVLAWKTTYSYLDGTAKSTHFRNNVPQKSITRSMQLHLTPLSEFNAFDPKHESGD